MNDTTTTPTLLSNVSERVLTLTINRPAQKNALDSTTYAALTAALAQATAREDLHAIVLTGAGGYFTAGNDLRDFVNAPEGASPGLTFLKTISKVNIPIIAAVEGGAVGIGVTMLLHCDFVVAGTGTQFRIPFVPLGLCPEGASSLLLARYVGIRKANEWLYRGTPFTAEEAQQAGLINRVVVAGQAESTAQELAREMANQSRLALTNTKALMQRAAAQDVAETLDAERERFAQCLASPEAKTAFSRFLAK
ncbi:enoyl-CoA hydratase [Advenella incenata]|jgi:enoyl-CoA hydratase/carnithine racemase|uniref:Enoyl-CoA hydratase n=1 Tax=Advenella incenata TaxID=267800 RepID=A0A4Q7V8K2_9BURK|nr:enoyl-CoA hydratase-related protein [Advenella incenata]RZT92775.1 enoyl-CoA hydratase [Advenella incenata]